MDDVLLEASQIRLYPIRKKDSKRPLPPSIAYVHHDYRKRIETVGSLLERMLPNTIHAVTAEGFELKVFLFALAYSFNCLEVATWVKLMHQPPDYCTPDETPEAQNNRGPYPTPRVRLVPRYGGLSVFFKQGWGNQTDGQPNPQRHDEQVVHVAENWDKIGN
jgi:hypothetical protein